MSSILKALRKLEEEKAANREGGLDIGRDILRGTVGRRPERSYLFPALILGIILLLGWGGYALFAPSAAVPVAGPPTEAVPTPQLPTPAGPVPLSAAAPSRPVDLLPRTIVAEPPVVEETIESREPASFSPSPRTRPVAAAKPQPAPAMVAVSAAAIPSAATTPPSPPAQMAPPVPPAAVQSPPQAPALLLTAIVYNELPEARLAVINDLPVMISTDVEGAVVEDILQDRVRLQQNGTSFEIGLSR